MTNDGRARQLLRPHVQNYSLGRENVRIHHKHMHSSSSSSVQLCVTDGRSSRTDKALPGFCFIYLVSVLLSIENTKCGQKLQLERRKKKFN